MLLAIFRTDFSLLRSFVASGDSSSKHPITWHFIAFVAAPEIERTETMDFILQFTLQPPTFLITEPPELGSSLQHCSSFFGFSFSLFFLSLSLLFSFAKSERLALWCSFSVSILGLLIFLLFADWLDSLFGFSFCKNMAQQLDFFQ